MEVVFYTQFKRPTERLEFNEGPKITETAGYIPAKQQIENLILAGQRLAEYREENYDFGKDDEIDEDFTDPTRSPNYDLADASQDALSVSRRLSERAKKAKEKKNVDEVKKDEPKAESKPSEVEHEK